jgi:hypothetical protein
MALACTLCVAACGGDEGGDGEGSDVLRDAVAKTEASKTARMTFTLSVSGGANERYNGEALIDFEQDRNHLSMGVEGQTV